MQNKLRKEVKLLKALQGISYTELAEYLEINRSSLYNWLKGQYDFSIQTVNRLQQIITNIKE